MSETPAPTVGIRLMGARWPDVPGKGKRQFATQTPSRILIGTGMGAMSRPGLATFRVTRVADSFWPLVSVVAGKTVSAASPWSPRDI
jgi:hypothetical protein